MKFATKLTLLFSAIYLLSGSIITLYIYNYNLNALKAQISRELEDHGFHTMYNIDRMLVDKYSVIRSLISDPIICSQSSTSEQILEKLKSFTSRNKIFVSAVFLGAKGNIVSDTSGRYQYDKHTFIKQWNDLSNGTEFTIDSLRMEPDNQPVFEIFAMVRNKAGLPIGIIASRAALADELYQIANQAAGVLHEGDEELKVELVDRNGLILYSSYRPADVMTRFSPDMEYIKKLISDQNMTASGAHNHPEIGQEIHVFARERGYLNFRGNGWTLLLHYPKDLAFAPAARLRNRVVMVLLIVGALTIYGLFALVRNVSRPIVELRDASIAISRGNLNIEIGQASGGEIGQLSSSFRQMVADLKRVRGSLKEEIDERKHAEEDLRRHAERLRILRSIDRAMQDLRSSDEISLGAIDQLRQLLLCRRASVALVDEVGDGLVIAAAAVEGKTEPGVGTRFSMDSAGEIFEKAKRGEIYLCNDTEALVHALPMSSTIEVEGIQSFVLVPLIFGGNLLGTLNLYSVMPNAFTEEEIEIAWEAADFLAVSIQNSRLFSSIHEKQEELRALTTRLVEVEEAERRRLAMELHDSIGQNLSALNLNLNIIARMLPLDSSQAKDRLEDSQTLLEGVVKCIRGMMSELRPPGMDEHGLGGALRWYVGQFTDRTSIPVELTLSEPLPLLTLTTQLTLFRIAQEALTNAARHSRAEGIWVTLQESIEGVRMTIADNGVGFDPEVLLQPGGRQGLGLLGMRERAEALGGWFRLESFPGKGTCLTVEV